MFRAGVQILWCMMYHKDKQAMYADFVIERLTRNIKVAGAYFIVTN